MNHKAGVAILITLFLLAFSANLSFAASRDKTTGRLYTDKHVYFPGEELTVRCFLYAGRDIGKIHLLLKDEKGSLFRRYGDITNLKKGYSRFEVPLDTEQIPHGNYRLELEDNSGNQILASTSPVAIINLQKARENIGELESHTKKLEALIKKASNQGIDSSYQKAVLGVTLYHLSPPFKVSSPMQSLTQEGVSSHQRFRKIRASKNIDYLSDLVRKAIHESENVLKNPSLQVKVPHYKMTDIKIKNGFVRGHGF